MPSYTPFGCRCHTPCFAAWKEWGFIDDFSSRPEKNKEGVAYRSIPTWICELIFAEEKGIMDNILQSQ